MKNTVEYVEKETKETKNGTNEDEKAKRRN